MAVNKKNRLIIFNKFDGKCAYCGCDLTKGWHVDEVLPIVRSTRYIIGLDGNRIWDKKRSDYVTENYLEFPERMHIDNQYPACASCNMLKGSQTLEAFRAIIQNFVNSLNKYTLQPVGGINLI